MSRRIHGTGGAALILLSLFGSMLLSSCAEGVASTSEDPKAVHPREGSTASPPGVVEGVVSENAYATSFPDIERGLDDNHSIAVSLTTQEAAVDEARAIRVAQEEMPSYEDIEPIAFRVLVTDRNYGPVDGGEVSPILRNRDAWLVVFPGVSLPTNGSYQGVEGGSPISVDTVEVAVLIDSETGDFLEAATV